MPALLFFQASCGIALNSIYDAGKKQHFVKLRHNAVAGRIWLLCAMDYNPLPF